MEYLYKIIFMMFLLTMAMTSTIFATVSNEDDNLDLDVPNEASSFIRQTGRFLANKQPRGWRTCDKYPRVCDNKGSSGPDCCKKQCVDVMVDKANCGKCGKKCKYSQLCCQGKCVNPSKDKSNCGSCNNKCKRGSSCAFGMCSYA